MELRSVFQADEGLYSKSTSIENLKTAKALSKNTEKATGDPVRMKPEEFKYSSSKNENRKSAKGRENRNQKDERKTNLEWGRNMKFERIKAW